MSGKKPFYHTTWFRGLVGFLVSAGCLWLAIKDMLAEPDAWSKILTAFRRANYASLPGILAILFVFYWLKAWRWQMLLAPVGRYRPVRDLLGPIMIGFGFNNVLPARLGEVLRCAAFSYQQKLSLAVSISSVVLERIFDGLAIVFYLTVGLFFVQGLDPRVQQGAMAFSAAAACVVAAAIVYVIWTKPFVNFLEGILKRVPLLPHALTDKLCRFLEAGALGLASLKDVRAIIVMLAISLVKWALNGLLVLLSLWSFDLPHTAPIAMVLLGAIAFGVALPSSPGYIGVMQFVFMKVMQFFTADQEGVFAASIYFQFTQWLPVTAIGLTYGMLFLVHSGMSLHQIEDLKEQLDESGPEQLENSLAEDAPRTQH